MIIVTEDDVMKGVGDVTSIISEVKLPGLHWGVRLFAHPHTVKNWRHVILAFAQTLTHTPSWCYVIYLM